MKIEELQDVWEKDSEINESNLGKEAIRVPVLHSKYLRYLSNTRLQLRKYESQYYRLRGQKLRYYRGEMSKEELAQLNWPQYLGPKPLRNEMEEALISDADIITAMDRVEYMKTMLYQLEQIIKSINSRTWDIKTAVDYYKFTHGSN